RFAAHLLRDNSQVDDVVQNVFLEAYRSSPRFRGDSAVKTWLFGIAANLVRGHRRSEHRRANATVALSSVPASRAPSVNELFTVEQRRRWVAAAIDSLTPAL